MNVQAGAPAAACVTVSVWPAIVTVPVRALPVFADALIVTVPLPVPPLAPLNVIQLALLVEVHAQPAPAWTLTGEVPAVPAIDSVVG